MSVEKELKARSEAKCELCGNPHDLNVFPVGPDSDGSANQSIYACNTCAEQLNDHSKIDPNHWRCLNDSMWSPTPAVQVVAYRMLHLLKNEGWPQDLIDMMYLEEETREWAEKEMEIEDPDAIKHIDSNGSVLASGDTVVLIKDLNVKGSSFVAKRGTAVRNISLVWDNAEQIEGRVNGQQIVILTKFVKKQG
ncbi:PhnA domain-containing protein [Persicobacter diffluens]|uniref:PhnA protein n=1 Tax=Persicobacter diffluens TaxID=981 RepID=A0AAN4W2Y9_9BACT|nr:PhnA protein [Persicobacter diffluens]